MTAPGAPEYEVAVRLPAGFAIEGPVATVENLADPNFLLHALRDRLLGVENDDLEVRIDGGPWRPLSSRLTYQRCHVVTADDRYLADPSAATGLAGELPEPTVGLQTCPSCGCLHHLQRPCFRTFKARGIAMLEIEHGIPDGPNFEQRALAHWAEFLSEEIQETGGSLFAYLVPEPEEGQSTSAAPAASQMLEAASLLEDRLWRAAAAVEYLEIEAADGLRLSVGLHQRLAAVLQSDGGEQ